MKDKLVIAGAVVGILLTIVALVWWLVFYFSQCAFVPLAEMPGICLLANNN